MAELIASKLYWHGWPPSLKEPRPFVEIPIYGCIHDDVMAFSAVLTSGKAYGLFGHIGDGAVAVSYMLAGMFPFRRGSITIDSRQYGQNDLASIGMVAWFERRWKRWQKIKTVQQRINEGFEASGNPHHIDGIEELKNLLLLTESRLDRPLTSCSNNRWRASLAIGLAEGKRIFTLPWMNPGFANCYHELWIRKCLDVLKMYDCWVLLPTSEPSSLGDAIDEVITVKGPYSDRGEDDFLTKV